LLVKDEVLLFIYVNDILVVSKTKQAYERFRDFLMPEFQVKELGKPKHILGDHVEFVKNEISLSQRQYIEEAMYDPRKERRVLPPDFLPPPTQSDPAGHDLPAT
jgi:hypothetical protein